MSSSLFHSSEARIRGAGYRLTKPRRTILRVLIDSDRHLTSTEILEKANVLNPEIGRASVFRVLDLLTELAIVRPTYVESRTPHYIFMPADGHHAHLVCTRCLKVFELGACEMEDMIQRLAKQHNLHPTGHVLEIFGICADCGD